MKGPRCHLATCRRRGSSRQSAVRGSQFAVRGSQFAVRIGVVMHSRSRCALVSMAAVVAVVALTAQGTSTPTKGRTIEVLLLGHNSTHHDSARFEPMLAKAIESEGFHFTYTPDPNELNAANLSLVAFSRFRVGANGLPDYNAQVFVFFVITVAAAEVAVGLALLVALYRARQTTDVADISSLKF